MDRTRLDVVVAAFVAAVLVLGGGAAWQTYRQAQAHGDMMGHGVTFHGPHPVWYLLGALLVAAVVAVAYAFVRDSIATDADRGERTSADRDVQRAERSAPASTADPNGEADDTGRRAADGTKPGDTEARPQVLSVLPEDERRVLEPVVETPGVTQIALRDRSGFSKSKVSQTVTDLEKRGLLYRERQGRTYRVYPSDELVDD